MVRLGGVELHSVPCQFQPHLQCRYHLQRRSDQLTLRIPCVIDDNNRQYSVTIWSRRFFHLCHCIQKVLSLRPHVLRNIMRNNTSSFTFDHRTWRTGLPVRSAVLKPCAGRLVVGWVTTSEYLLLNVFVLLSSWSRVFTGSGLSWRPEFHF